MKTAAAPTTKDIFQRIFRLGKKVELAFDHDSLRPSVRSTIINECDYGNKNITIAQSTPRILPSFREKKLKMTTLILDNKEVAMRVGVKCYLAQFLNDYQLSKGITEPALIVSYHLPISRSNIRGAYRISPNQRFNVSGKILLNGRTLFSDKAFKIKDISGTGIGLPIIRTFKASNPLLNMDKGKEVNIELALEDHAKKTPITIMATIQVIRNNRFSNTKEGFIGGRYISIRPEDEERLFQFIHDAQAHEIRTRLNN